MEIGWTELLVIGIVALIVIGPKDLPAMFRELGRFTAKLRRMSGDFSRAMEQAARETGVKDVADDLRKVASPKSMGLDAMKSAADKFEKWDPLKPASRVSSPAPGAVTPSAVAVSDAVPPQPVAPPLGPATAALAEKTAIRRAAAKEAVKPASAPAPSKPDAPQKPPGRVRTKKPTVPASDSGAPGSPVADIPKARP